MLGAGGFAQEVRWLISEINLAQPAFEFAGYLVSDLDRLTERDARDEVLGDLSWLDANPERVDALALGIGDPSVRVELGEKLRRAYPGLEWPRLIHPGVRLDRATSELGDGVLLCAGTIGTVHLAIDSFVMVNLACTIGHGAHLGPGCVLNPTVNISGGVDLEERVLVGTGAQVLQYVRVGAGATIGAGAVVHRDVEAGRTVVGVPARPLERKASPRPDVAGSRLE